MSLLDISVIPASSIIACYGMTPPQRCSQSPVRDDAVRDVPLLAYEQA